MDDATLISAVKTKIKKRECCRRLFSRDDERLEIIISPEASSGTANWQKLSVALPINWLRHSNYPGKETKAMRR